MKRNLLSALVVLLGICAQAQTTITTSPPLTPNNGSAAVVFEVSSLASINITAVSNAFNVGTVAVDIWYRVGGALHSGATTPSVTTANDWILAGSVSGLTSTVNTVPIAIPFVGFNVPVLAGQTIGFAITGAGCRYMTYVSTNQTDFSASGVTVKTGPGSGFGGTFPNVSIADRQFAGSLTFMLQGPCTNPPFVGNAITDKANTCPGETFTLSIDTATYGSGQSYQWQISTDSIVWTNLVNDTLAVLSRSQTSTNYYRCQFTCGVTTNSGGVKVTTDNNPLLAGTYTINNALPTSGTNFASFFDFVESIKCAGITGSVVINVAQNSGPYDEEVYLGNIVGTSATSTITINGNGNTLLKTTPGSNRAVITFDATQYVFIDSLTITNLQTANAYGIEMRNDARFITINNCVIDIDQTATGTTVAGIVTSNSLTSATTAGLAARDITITNCEIIGGYYGLVLNGPTSAPWSNNNVVENNTVRDFYAYGIYGRGQQNSVIKGNDITRAMRSTITTFYGIYFISGMEDVLITQNSIHNISDGGVTTTASYPIYITGGLGSSTAPAIISNNLIYNINNNGIQYGIYVLGTSDNLHFYHNTVSVGDVNSTNSSAIRSLFVATTTTGNNFIYANNIFDVQHGGTGLKFCVYLSSANPTHNLNYNQYHMNSGGTTNHIGYFGANQTTFLDWQTVNSGAFEQNGVEGNPVFAGPLLNDMTPLSGVGNNVGQNLSSIVSEDFFGTTRPMTPDIGAIEYTPITEDIAVISGALTKGQCLSTNDTLMLEITNTIGGTVNFATDSVVAMWQVTGPVNSSGTITVNSGSLALNSSLTLEAYSVNLSEPGIYTLNAYIQPNAMNLSATNDTLLPVTFVVNEIFVASPQNDTVYTTTDSVEINLNSKFLPTGSVFITEVCQYKLNNTTPAGGPIGGWPAYLVADDYIEITGVPGSDLAGYKLEQWSTTALVSDNIFGVGTVFSPSGTMIVAVGQLGASVPSPTDFYYHDGNTSTFSSTGATGRIIKDPNGNIVDAVGYGNYTFPAAANVTAADWSGTTPSLSSAGNRLEGAYTKDATNWVNSTVSPQDPNTVNANVVVPSPQGISGFTWTLNGVVVDTVPNVFVGPWSVAGLYQYVATYNTPCGILTDTVNIYVDIPMPCDAPTNAASTNVGCDELDITWDSDVNMLSSKIEYGPTGFTPGSGTMINNATSPQTVSGLMANANYDFHIIDSCAAGASTPAMISATTEPLPVADAFGTLSNVTIVDATADFDASASTDYTSIEWIFGDGNMGTGVMTSHTYLLNDIYDVEAIAIGDCGMDTLKFQFTVAGIGISESEMARSLKIYPNPTSGLVRVELFSTVTQQISVQVSNVSGQTLVSLPAEMATGAYTTNLDLTNYPAGIYLMQIITQEGVITRRINLSK